MANNNKKVGYIYKIYDNTNGDVYYGSTGQLVSKRMTCHRDKYKKYLQGECGFITSFKILENENYSYNVVEKVEFEDKFELLTRERFYIENNECVNKYIPTRTVKEYYESYKEKFKQHYETNKDEILDQRKQYYEVNKDKVIDRSKQYYESNKERIIERKKEKITCECGCIVRKNHISRHQRTAKHKKLLASATTQ